AISRLAHTRSRHERPTISDRWEIRRAERLRFVQRDIFHIRSSGRTRFLDRTHGGAIRMMAAIKAWLGSIGVSMTAPGKSDLGSWVMAKATRGPWWKTMPRLVTTLRTPIGT